jgi:hypothetical protein
VRYNRHRGRGCSPSIIARTDCGVEWLATLVAVTCVLQHGADFTVGQAAYSVAVCAQTEAICDGAVTAQSPAERTA